MMTTMIKKHGSLPLGLLLVTTLVVACSDNRVVVAQDSGVPIDGSTTEAGADGPVRRSRHGRDPGPPRETSPLTAPVA